MGVQVTIVFVCKVLIYVGVHSLTPEAFRLAKQNNTSSTLSSRLWRALHDLIILQLIQFKTKNDEPNEAKQKKFAMDELWEHIVDEKLSHITGLVQYYLTFWGYPNSARISEMSFESCETRELLLAFGWLMAKVNVFQQYLDKYTENNTLHANLPLPPFPFDSSHLFQRSVKEELEKTDKLYHEMITITAEDVHSTSELRVNQIKTIFGKIIATQKSLSALETRYANIVHDVQIDQLKTDRTPLTPYEIFLMKNPTVLQQQIERLSSFNKIMEMREMCKTHQDIFWAWMESVLSEEEKSEENNSNQNSNNNNDTFQQPSPTLFKQLQESVSSEIIKQEKDFGVINRDWLKLKDSFSAQEYEKVKTVLQPIADQVSQKVSSIDEMYKQTLSEFVSGVLITESDSLLDENLPLSILQKIQQSNDTKTQTNEAEVDFAIYPKYTPETKPTKKIIKFSPYFPASQQPTVQENTPAVVTSEKQDIKNLHNIITQSNNSQADWKSDETNKILIDVIQPMLDARQLQLMQFKK
eukprot:TRINITY_DN7850_c0_g1_i1.p1 TRINITY_DN7850_c0_g1~~TRINITY_DN7850_c0_g1_i1.p1  ORF type:complete len:526 (-),score=112.52 TRINITY_DN7850_c0_g1_i1:295-1872(-)